MFPQTHWWHVGHQSHCQPCSLRRRGASDHPRPAENVFQRGPYMTRSVLHSHCRRSLGDAILLPAMRQRALPFPYSQVGRGGAAGGVGGEHSVMLNSMKSMPPSISTNSRYSGVSGTCMRAVAWHRSYRHKNMPLQDCWNDTDTRLATCSSGHAISDHWGCCRTTAFPPSSCALPVLPHPPHHTPPY
jgi:hypothetical protein